MGTPPSRARGAQQACAGGQCRCCGGRAGQDGGVAPRQHSMTTLALAGWRPAQLPFWTQAGRTAKRSGAASRPGNEVFALLGRTGTGQCLVAVTGTGCEERGVPVHRRRRLQPGWSRLSQQAPVSQGRGPSAPVGGFWPPPKDGPSTQRNGNGGNRSAVRPNEDHGHILTAVYGADVNSENGSNAATIEQ